MSSKDSDGSVRSSDPIATAPQLPSLRRVDGQLRTARKGDHYERGVRNFEGSRLARYLAVRRAARLRDVRAERAR